MRVLEKTFTVRVCDSSPPALALKRVPSLIGIDAENEPSAAVVSRRARETPCVNPLW
jgi:hypothetical protein